jgi:hypothetical protein
MEGIKIMKDKFYNKNGSLTAYSLACGYIEKKEKNNVTLTLWKEGCYHVRKHNHFFGKRIFWQSFNSLTKARQFFKENWKE